MTTIAVPTTTLRDNLSVTLDTVASGKKIALITKKGKPVSALVNLDFLEDLLALSLKKYLADIKSARQEYKKGDFLTYDQVFGKL